MSEEQLSATAGNLPESLEPSLLGGWISLAVRRPVALLMIFSAVGVFGLISLERLPVDLMPEVNRPTVTVRTDYPGAAPEDVEERVAIRLEKTLSVVKGLRRITSISRAETCDVVLEFTWNADLRDAVQDIREKLDQAFLPDDVETPSVLRYDPRLDPVLRVGLEGSLDLRSLRRVAEEEVERRLETVEGIAAVRVRGGLEEEIAIFVDEELLRSRGVTLERIGQRLTEENLDRAAGRLSDGDMRYIVRTRNEFLTLEEVADIPIRVDGDSILRLSDVATVTAGSKEDRVITRIGGRPAVQIEILREGDANIVDLAERVRERLFGTASEQRQLEKWRTEQETGVLPESGRATKRPDFVAGWIPPEAHLVLLSDQSVFIEGAIHDLELTAALGGFLAILVLFLFLGRVSYTLVVAVTIPVSVIATFAPMYVGEISLNIMSLGGLALGIGMLVDSSIVVLESIFRRREAGDSPITAAIVGGREVSGAVFASTTTTVAVFFPIVFVEGMAGQFFRDQALTVVLSLIASLVVSLTLVPMLAGRLGGWGGISRSESPSFGWYRWRTAARWRSFLTWVKKRELYGMLVAGIGSPVFFNYFVLSVFLDVGGSILFFFLFLTTRFAGMVALIVSAGFRFVATPVVTLFRKGYESVENAYVALIAVALTKHAVVLVLVAGAATLAYSMFGGLGSELVPEVSRGEFTLHVQYPVGTPLLSTDRFARELERSLVQVPGIRTVATTVGRDPEEVRESQDGEHSVKFAIQLETGAASAEVSGRRLDPELLEERVLVEIAKLLDTVDDHEVEVRRPTLFSTQSPIEIEIRGPELNALIDLDREVRAILATIPQLREVRSTVATGSPEYHLFPDRDALARHGVTSEQIATVLRRKNLGEVVSRFRSDDRRIDMRVQVRPEDRQSMEDLLALVVQPRVGGGGLRLGDLLERWEPREGPAEIRRIGRQRAVVISAEIEGIDLGRIAGTIEDRLLQGLTLPPEAVVEVVGQKKEM